MMRKFLSILAALLCISGFAAANANAYVGVGWVGDTHPNDYTRGIRTSLSENVGYGCYSSNADDNFSRQLHMKINSNSAIPNGSAEVMLESRYHCSNGTYTWTAATVWNGSYIQLANVGFSAHTGSHNLELSIQDTGSGCATVNFWVDVTAIYSWNLGTSGGCLDTDFPNGELVRVVYTGNQNNVMNGPGTQFVDVDYLIDAPPAGAPWTWTDANFSAALGSGDPWGTNSANINQSFTNGSDDVTMCVNSFPTCY